MAQLDEIYDQLKPLLETYEKKLVNKSSKPTDYMLYSVKKIMVNGKPADEMFFAGLMTKKGHVGFYFMPIYTHPDKFTDIPAELKKCLKGKSCFLIKKSNPVVDKQIKDILKKGYEVYKEEGWI